MGETIVDLVHISGAGRNVGKTSLGETLARMLSSRGWLVVAVKHVHHGVDYRVKDTGRYLSAGAFRVIAVAPNEHMVVEERGLSLNEALCKAVEGLEGRILVIVEGFRGQQEALREAGACLAYIDEHSVCSVESGEARVKTGIREAAEILATLISRGSCRARLRCA